MDKRHHFYTGNIPKIPYCTVSIGMPDLLSLLEYKSRYLKVIGTENAIDKSSSTFSSGCFGGLYEKLNRFKYPCSSSRLKLLSE